ncbi:MAG: sulfotransferase, partial [Arenicellales bacterium]
DMQCDAADLYVARGQMDRADQLLRTVLQEQPLHFRAHLGLGNLARQRHQLDLAEYHYRQAFYQRQFAPRVLNELGGVLSALGRKHEAEHYFRVALAQAPDDPVTLINWCRMEESRGDLPKAWRLLEMARKNSGDGAGVGITEAVLHRRENNYKQALLALEGVDLDKLDGTAKAACGFERGAILDRMGLHGQAFECIAGANSIKENELGFGYDADKHASEADRLRLAFTSKRMKSLEKGRPAVEGEEQPVFICGFTRSGTSMVEQILSAHSRICGGDELPFIYDLATNAGRLLNTEAMFPDCLFADSAPGQAPPLQLLRQRYLSRLRLTSVLEPGVRKFTDKMPMNELHLGLIHGLFPESKIIHVVRHPLDAVLSTFFTDATHGGNCGYDLLSAARHYRLLLEMTEHYRRKLGIDFLRVRYEDVVRDIRKQTVRMLEHLEEQLEDACLRFHENPRYSRTASYAQVTEELYDTSVYRYRKYRKHLKPIIPELESSIKLLGYKL